MSKKVVIVLRYKWCRVDVTEHNVEFNYHTSRRNARMWARSAGGKARKVSKIVYHYE